MFAEERLDAILKALNIHGKVKVKDLSSTFNVTEDCIRKDLKNLEQQGFLKRTYGGAVINRSSAKEHNIFSRKEINIPSKSLIVKKALDLVEDRETIFLDISTTNILLSKLILDSKKKVTIVTNMLEILNVLSSDCNATVVSTGGVLNRDLNGFTGSATINLISQYKFDKAFIGSCGINVFDNTVTTFDIEDGITKKSIIKSSKKNYLVMESSKFYSDGNYKFSSLDSIDCILSDKSPNAEILNILKELDISFL